MVLQVATEHGTHEALVDGRPRLDHAQVCTRRRSSPSVAVLFPNSWQNLTLIREQTNELDDDPTWAADPDLRYVSEKTLRLWRRTGDAVQDEGQPVVLRYGFSAAHGPGRQATRKVSIPSCPARGQFVGLWPVSPGS
jgi:hypothetical protein